MPRPALLLLVPLAQLRDELLRLTPSSHGIGAAIAVATAGADGGGVISTAGVAAVGIVVAVGGSFEYRADGAPNIHPVGSSSSSRFRHGICQRRCAGLPRSCSSVRGAPIIGPLNIGLPVSCCTTTFATERSSGRVEIPSKSMNG